MYEGVQLLTHTTCGIENTNGKGPMFNALVNCPNVNTVTCNDKVVITHILWYYFSSMVGYSFAMIEL